MSARKLCCFLWAAFAAICWLNGCARKADAQVFMVKTEIRVCTPINCRIEVGTGSSFCVGNIGERYYFVTAGHCCYAHGAGIIGSKLLGAHVAIDEQWVPARVDGFDKPNDASDLALFSLVPGKPLHSLRVAERMPPVGSQVTIGGFPSGSPYAEVKGNLLPQKTGDRQTDYLVSTAVVRGVSGGAVLFGGEAVGVVSASDFGSGTWVVGPEKIRAKLTQLLGRLPDCGKPRPEIPAQLQPEPKGEPKDPQPYRRDDSAPPAAPPAEPQAPTADEEPGNSGRVLPGIAGAVAGAAAGKAATWFSGWAGLALGGPLGAAVAVAGSMLIRRLVSKGVSTAVTRAEERIEQRFGERWQSAPSPPPPIPQSQASPGRVAVVETESRPLPPNVVHTSEFIPVEVNPHGRAFVWAKRKLVERYPDAASAVEVLESLIKQYRDALAKGQEPL